MFLLDAPPDTSAYMVAGYAVFFIVSAVYLLSLFLRWRNLDQDRKTLEEMQNEAKQRAARRTKK